MFLDGVSGALPVGPTLKLTPDQANGLAVSGFAGCGDFSGAAMRTGVTIQFTGVAPTANATCASEARVLENQYVTALNVARRLTIRGGYLVLMDEGGRDRAYFVPG